MSTKPDLGYQIRALLAIALPLTTAYIGEFAMFVTSKMVVGQLGYIELAAVGIAGNLSFEILVILSGLLSIVGVLCAQSEGAGKKQQVGLVVRQGFIIAVLLGIPSTMLIWHLDQVLVWTGQDPEVIAAAGPYLRYLSGLSIPFLLFAVLRNFIAALSKPKAIMVIMLLAVGVNYLLTLWLVHGGFGVPAMGVAGAGLATNIVAWLMLFCLFAYVYKTEHLRGYGVFAGLQFDLCVCREIMALGLPVAGLVFIEAGMFSAASILSGIINAETLAAYEVVTAWAGIPFVIAMGVAEATMVRVAHGVGRGAPELARFSGLLGINIGTLSMLVLTIIPIVFATFIINLFISPNDSGYAIVSVLAAELLVIATIFQVFDGLQAIAARALRGVKDSAAPLWIAAFGYWVLGIGGGALLAFQFKMGGAGLWWGLAMGLSATGLLLAWRFHKVTAKMLRDGANPG